jgi:hypothetical protein
MRHGVDKAILADERASFIRDLRLYTKIHSLLLLFRISCEFRPKNRAVYFPQRGAKANLCALGEKLCLDSVAQNSGLF